jgi:glycosyltransferase involved in cell wall biosynthesis
VLISRSVPTDDPQPVPRLLFLSPVVPAPLDRGQNVRVHNLVLGLARRFRVTLVVPHGPGLDEESPLWTAVEELVVVPARSAPPSVVELLRFMARNRTVVRRGVAGWLMPFQEAIDLLQPDRFAAFWVERLGQARLLAGVADRVVVDLDDLEHRKWARELRLHARTDHGWALLRRFYYTVRFAYMELVGARRYGCCAVASSSDAGYLRSWGVRSSAMLPNGATVSATAPHERGVAGVSGRVVFLGNLGYPPNVDALVHLDEHVLPVLRARGVPVQVSVVGPGVTEALRRRFPQLVFRGFAPDLGAALRDADICVVPLRLGGGTKVKVLDAMAAGVPVVTTPVGAEGLGLTHGVHALIAEPPDEFAEAVARVLQDEVLARSLAGAARRLVEDDYSWQSVQDRAIALADAVTADKQRI